MKRRVLRSGSYYGFFVHLRSTFRYWSKPERRNWNRGFRIVVRRRKQ